MLEIKNGFLELPMIISVNDGDIRTMLSGIDDEEVISMWYTDSEKDKDLIIENYTIAVLHIEGIYSTVKNGYCKVVFGGGSTSIVAVSYSDLRDTLMKGEIKC